MIKESTVNKSCLALWFATETAFKIATKKERIERNIKKNCFELWVNLKDTLTFLHYTRNMHLHVFMQMHLYTNRYTF